jgi:hypothetical protein
MKLNLNNRNEDESSFGKCLLKKATTDQDLINGSANSQLLL